MFRRWFTAIFTVWAVTISWQVPSPDCSGIPPAGYKVYCGDKHGEYTRVKDVGDALSYTEVDGALIPVGKVSYCAITAYNAQGCESAYSKEVVMDRQPPAAPW